jgi:hypothetical protein
MSSIHDFFQQKSAYLKSTPKKQPMNKLPFRVTLLYLLVLTLSAWNGLRLWTALAWQNVLTEFSASPPPIIIAISGALWMVTGFILIWSIWQKKAWAAKLLIGVASGYSVWYWSERLLWQNPHPNWLFAVIVNLAGIAFILLTVKSLSREAYERENENPAPD